MSKANRKAVKTAAKKLGGWTGLATAIDTSPALVRYWATHSKKGASAGYVLKIERATGVPRHELRPDLYPREQFA